MEQNADGNCENTDSQKEIRLYIRRTQEIQDQDIPEYDKKQIKNFLLRMEVEGIAVSRRIMYIYAIQTLLKATEKPLQKLREQDIEQFILYMTRQKYATQTKKTRWYGVKKLLQYLGKEEIMQEIKPKFIKDKGKLPEECLTREEVLKMIDSTSSLRNQAFLAVLYESGCRPGEFLSMKNKDIEFDQLGAKLRVRGKMGERLVRITWTAPILQQWINSQPHSKNRDMWVWAEENPRQPIGNKMANKILKKTAKRAGIQKKVHMNLFRHTRATHLAPELSEMILRKHMGWAMDSRVPANYVHLSMKDVDESLTKMNQTMKPKPEPEKNSIQDFGEMLVEMFAAWKTMQTTIQPTMQQAMQPTIH